MLGNAAASRYERNWLGSTKCDERCWLVHMTMTPTSRNMTGGGGGGGLWRRRRPYQRCYKTSARGKLLITMNAVTRL